TAKESCPNLLRLESRRQRTDFSSHRSSGKANTILTSCQAEELCGSETRREEHSKEHAQRLVRESQRQRLRFRSYHESIRTPKATSDAAPHRRHVTFSFSTYLASSVSSK